uniref:50S ribosomal protein L18 n=1 Tax=Strongyloides venezuelensis TaxID=75913 RepID=A0A0K0FJM3_STRVS
MKYRGGRRIKKIDRFLKKNCTVSLLCISKRYFSNSSSYIFQNEKSHINDIFEIAKKVSLNLSNGLSRTVAVSLGISLMKLLRYKRNISKRKINVCIRNQNVFVEIKRKSCINGYGLLINRNIKKQFGKNITDSLQNDLTFKLTLPPVRMFPRRGYMPRLSLL